jgi:hypothetical protein
MYHVKCVKTAIRWLLSRKRNDLFVTTVHFHNYFVPESLKWGTKEREVQKVRRIKENEGGGWGSPDGVGEEATKEGVLNKKI